MKIFIIVSIILKITFVYSQDISYIRYYANEKDFKDDSKSRTCKVIGVGDNVIYGV